MKSKIVLAITDQETNAQLAKLGVGLLELRVDLFKKIDVDYVRRQFQMRRALRIPLIVTIRNQKKEGAVKQMPDAKKWELLQALIPMSDWVDIELSSPLCAATVTLARSLGKGTIVSAHDFTHMPEHLEQTFKKALSTRADMVKLAVKAQGPEDVMRMVDFTHRNRKYALVTMCLGSWGALSRIVLPAAGSRWIYSFLNKPTAPGQIDVKTLQSHLKLYYP